MAIVNALAGIMVSDLTTAEAWYEQVLARPTDSRPMEGLAEWKLANGGWIQVFQDKERAGSNRTISSVMLSRAPPSFACASSFFAAASGASAASSVAAIASFV